jgi:hypothetical protein
MLRLVKQGGRIQRGGPRVAHFGSCGSVNPCFDCGSNTGKFDQAYANWFWHPFPN